MASISVPRTRWSISAGLESHSTSCCGLGAVGQKMSEDFLGRLGEELTLLVTGRLVERGRDSLGFGLAAQLLGRSPVGAPLVQRIEYQVAPLLVVEPLNELASRVVDDGRMTPTLYLPEHLHNQSRFAGPCVAHEFDMLRLGLQRDTHHVFGFGRDEADAIAIHGLVELFRCKQDWAFEPPSILQFLASADVFANGERELREQRKEAEEERRSVDAAELIAAEDGGAEVGMERRIEECLLRAAIENA